MLSFMSDRRVLAVSAAFITAAIFLFLLATYPSWKAAIGDGLAWRRNAADVPAAGSAPPVPSAPATVGTPVKPASGKQSAAPASAAAPALASAPEVVPQPAAAASATPSFDVVRVEPSGDSVIAARGKPGETIVLLDQGHPIARAQADSGGQVAFVPPALAPGEHSLMLSLGEPNASGALSSQSVAVSVPERAKAAPLVALLQPDQPTKLLSGVTPAGQGTAISEPPVSVGAIDVEEMGSVYATGRATPGSQCRIYLNGSFVAGVKTGSDGTWSLKIERGMRPGHYSVRVDELASAAGDVRARAEVPFDYPARATAAVSLLRPKKGQVATAMPLPGAPAAGTTTAGRSAAPASTASVGAVPAQAGVDFPPSAPSAVVLARSVPNGADQIASAVDGPASAPSPGVPTVVAQLLTTKVVHGDSLWRISRKMLGRGRRYTQIYAANTTQIRDPKLIYPGQIFVMPQNAP